MGWERKRGKLEEFNRLLRGATDTSFTDPRRPRRRAAGIRYVHHARFRYAAAARHRARADRHHRASAEPAGGRSAAAARHRRLRHPAAARQRDDGQRRRVAVRAHLCRPHRRRSVHDRGVRRVPGSVRRRHLHRQGPLRRRRVHGLARGPRAGERAAVARPVRRPARARRARHRHRGRGRLSVERADARAGGSIAGCAATGRSCGGCSRGCRRGRASSATACRSSRAGRFSTTCAAAWCRRRWWRCSSPAGRSCPAARSSGRCVAMATMSFPRVSRACSSSLGGPRSGQGIRVFVRSTARGSRRPISRASACS